MGKIQLFDRSKTIINTIRNDGITKITMVTNTVIKMKAIDQQFKTVFDINKMV